MHALEKVLHLILELDVPSYGRGEIEARGGDAGAGPWWPVLQVQTWVQNWKTVVG